ncbi:MAG: bifunctional oligoribonuclease/PAP phosphatase NrnA [Tannerellaceae bacterium]|jgi:phosphoesterase RecJ-like protein|nr:bifunctional oligoribonuclease/PAP phosphatase NrnA [Tannerellaceae bacterium]
MLTKIIQEEQIQKAKRYIDKGNNFLLIAHVAPDGDALGASLGLFHYLNTCGKEKVSVVVPNSFPAYYRWMPGAKDIVIHERYPDFAEQLIHEADVIFCLDFNEPKRVGKLSEHLTAAKGRKILIDHHLHPADFCRVTISYPEMSSTSEMIFRFICRMGMYEAIGKSAAECIYTGMMTDTGAFTYNSNHPEIYLIISQLLKKGIDKDLIYRRVHQVYSESRLRLMGYALNEKMKVYPKQHTALITLTQEELLHFQYTTGDTEGFVNLPLSIAGVDFSAFIREDPDCVKISLRSVGDFPCNEFAGRYFNGGGHKNASGGEFFGTPADAVNVFEKALKELGPDKRIR